MKACGGLFGLLLVLCGCGDGEDLGDRSHVGAGMDAGDPAQTTACLACHTLEGQAWQNPSSHRTLFACTSCHTLLSNKPGPGHAHLPACGDCHSELPHPTASAACTGCHDQHGSPNAFLIRATLARPDGTPADVHFTAPEGESADGLVHAGAQAGSGLCETCHTKTKHYLANGQGSAHYTEHCTECHDHQAGFAKP